MGQLWDNCGTIMGHLSDIFWSLDIHTKVASWMMNNLQPIGGPGVVVELDEAKFGKRKFNRGAYREGMWVLGAVDRSTGKCILLPCPNNNRSAATLLPMIQRWVLPGSIIHTDEWRAYNSLDRMGYDHRTVNHSIQFVDPTTAQVVTPTHRRVCGTMLRDVYLVAGILNKVWLILCLDEISTLLVETDKSSTASMAIYMSYVLKISVSHNCVP